MRTAAPPPPPAAPYSPAGSPTQGSPVPWALRSPRAFGAAMIALAFALKLIVSPLAVIFGTGGAPGVAAANGALFVLASFAFLPVETLVGQALPIWFLKKLGLRKHLSLSLLSGLFFGLLHAPLGVVAFAAGLAGGIVFSYCWLSWRVLSFGNAFWRTTLVHAGHNAVAFLIQLALLMAA